jgi:hypothetical protein
MDHTDLYLLRETYNQKDILLCFNGPFSQGLIEEIGNALRSYMKSDAEHQDISASSSRDVFAVYIEIAQNIRHYSVSRGYSDAAASATVVISRTPDGSYGVSAGNVVEPADGEALVRHIESLAALDKDQLKAAYKAQLRKPREENASGAGLGLIDIARKASACPTCSLRPVNSGQQMFFTLRVEI